jgi:hypothetical protein
MYNQKMNPNLSNSIYQQKNSIPGLGVECGMLINNRPDSTTGIQKAVETKKMLRRMEKTSVYADAISQVNMRNRFGM